jgi:hypothetical protein
MSGSREWKAGRQDLRFDEASRILRVYINEPMSVEEYREITRITEEIFGERRPRSIWDLQGKSLGLSRDVRRAMSEQMKADRKRGLSRTGRSAIVGATHGVRVLAMIMLRLLGSVDQTRFCSSEKEAIAFLDEEP